MIIGLCPDPVHHLTEPVSQYFLMMLSAVQGLMSWGCAASTLEELASTEPVSWLALSVGIRGCLLIEKIVLFYRVARIKRQCDTSLFTSGGSNIKERLIGLDLL